MLSATDAGPPALDVDFTGCGIIDNMMPLSGSHKVKVEHLEFRVAGYTPAAGMWAYTYRGELNLVYAFNDGYRSRASGKSFLSRMMEIVATELDIRTLASV